MGRPPTPKPDQIFEALITDAEHLVRLSRALTNSRQRAMRRELRESFGSVLRLRKSDVDQLDCVESDDLFVVIKPASTTQRSHFSEPELRPLLRQAIVATAAAVESYIAEKASTFITEALVEPTRRLKEVPLSLGDLMDIETKYTRRRWGIRSLLRTHFEVEASPSSSKIGKVMATVGKKNFWDKVDTRRGLPKGTSAKELDCLAERRNRIAHAGDRKGSGREPLSIAEVEDFIKTAREVVAALDQIL